MATFKLTLEYDGTEFAGWQTQPEGQRTVQETLERALHDVTGWPVSVVGAGRTDAGVHAEGQVAGCTVETRLEPETLARALNANLPGDLCVVAAAYAGDTFHARRDARSKRYRYAIWNARTPSPLRARRFHHVPAALDVDAMREAARALEGRHDFKSFQAAGSAITQTVRTMSRLAVEASNEVDRSGGAGELFVEVDGDGFLRHMVRNLVGTLLEVGSGRRDPASLPALLAAQDRREAGPTAPARGLTLVRVDYGPSAAG